MPNTRILIAQRVEEEATLTADFSRRTAASQRRLVLLADAPKMRAARRSEHQLSFTEPDGRLCDTPDTLGRHGFKKKEKEWNKIKVAQPSLAGATGPLVPRRDDEDLQPLRMEWNTDR